MEYLSLIMCVQGGTNVKQNICKITGWGGIQVTRCPRPYPDYSREQYHYLPYEKSPREAYGMSRKSDDFQPRCQLKHTFDNGLIHSNNMTEIRKFCDKYIVNSELLTEYIKHLENLNECKKHRTEEQR